MPDLHELLDRRAAEFEPTGPGLGAVRERAGRRSRARRLEAATLAIALAVGAGVGLWRAFSPGAAPQPVRTPPPQPLRPGIIATIALHRGIDMPTDLVAAG